MKKGQKYAVISQPMAGMSGSEVRKVRDKIIKDLKRSGYKVFETYYDNEEPYLDNDRNGVNCLGDVLKKIALSDLVVFVEGWEQARGCQVEHLICERYNIPHIVYGVDKID